MTTHTHVGYQPHVGHIHCGSALWGHHIPRAGRRHALIGGPDQFRALCGETVALRRRNEYGEEVPPNVRPIGDPEARPVTCRRCLRLLKSLDAGSKSRHPFHSHNPLIGGLV